MINKMVICIFLQRLFVDDAQYNWSYISESEKLNEKFKIGTKLLQTAVIC
jgi:hypothetical protein